MQSKFILHFWFEELTAKQHFVNDTALDDTVRTRFGDTLAAAARCDLFAWCSTARGRLAAIVLLNQFSRSQRRAIWCGVSAKSRFGPYFSWPQDLALH